MSNEITVTKVSNTITVNQATNTVTVTPTTNEIKVVTSGTRIPTIADLGLAGGTNINFNQTTGVIATVATPAFTQVTISAEPTAANNVATKNYVDSAVSGAGPTDTDAVPEGSTNLYYTDTRARAALSATGPVSYNATTGVISSTQHTINGAADVVVNTLEDGSILVYSTATNKWTATKQLEKQVLNGGQY